jgi:glycine oxidase
VAAPTDVVIVGAGVIGCAVAFELARRGASVNIIDDRPAGMGATQASAGILAPYIESRHPSPLLDLTSKSLDLFDTFVARVDSASGMPIPYKRTGTLDVAGSEESLADLRALASTLAGRGVTAELLDRRTVRDREPHLAEDVAGGLLIACHGYVSAPDLTKALVAAARHHGAQVVEQGRVRRILRSGGDLKIETDRGSLLTNAAVIAAGSWSSQIDIEGAGPLPVRPVRGQLLRFGWSGSPLTRVIWGERCYLVPWDEGTLLVGATVEDAGFDERATVAGVRDLIEAAAELIPAAWTSTFQSARAGLRPATPDDLPIIGRSSVIPNVVYATGHFRNGILLAPLTAKLVADEMLEDIADPLLGVTRPARFGRF